MCLANWIAGNDIDFIACFQRCILHPTLFSIFQPPTPSPSPPSSLVLLRTATRFPLPSRQPLLRCLRAKDTDISFNVNRFGIYKKRILFEKEIAKLFGLDSKSKSRSFNLCVARSLKKKGKCIIQKKKEIVKGTANWTTVKIAAPCNFSNCEKLLLAQERMRGP